MARTNLKRIATLVAAAVLLAGCDLRQPVEEREQSGDVYAPQRAAIAMAAQAVAKSLCKAPLNARPTVVQAVDGFITTYEVLLTDNRGAMAADAAAITAAKAALAEPCADEAGGVEALSTDEAILYGEAWVANTVAGLRCVDDEAVVRELVTLMNLSLEGASDDKDEVDAAGVPPDASPSQALALKAQRTMAQPCPAP